MADQHTYNCPVCGKPTPNPIGCGCTMTNPTHEEQAREPKFGEWFRGIYASEDNPIRDGMYVRTIRRTGRLNRGTFYELTNLKGKFWEFPRDGVVRIEAPPHCPIAQAEERGVVKGLRLGAQECEDWWDHGDPVNCRWTYTSNLEVRLRTLSDEREAS